MQPFTTEQKSKIVRRIMDRRQKKTRELIFKAFIKLLSKKHFNKITVGEIIENADVGRATFYAHFETKEFLLKELCKELFCHIFDSIEDNKNHHKHIFDCTAPSSVILHLLQHLQKNDNNVLDLLVCENNDLFLRYFKENLKELFTKNKNLFEIEKVKGLPEDFLINHVSSTFVETVKWWIQSGMKETAETVASYFLTAIRL